MSKRGNVFSFDLDHLNKVSEHLFGFRVVRRIVWFALSLFYLGLQDQFHRRSTKATQNCKEKSQVEIDLEFSLIMLLFSGVFEKNPLISEHQISYFKSELPGLQGE